jgi:hypothetical protein
MSNGPPYLLAILIGLLISATLHLLFVWPGQEPDEDEDFSES